MQPRLCALPVVVWSTRPRRADDRGGDGADRRDRRDADLLHQYRRWRTHDPARLLRAGRARRPSSGGRQVLDERHAYRRRRGQATGQHGLSGHPDLGRRRRPGDQRPLAWRGQLRGREASDGPPARRGLRSVQDLGRHDARQRRAARRVRGTGGGLRRATSSHEAATLGAWRRRLGGPAPDPGTEPAPLPLAGRASERSHRRLVLPPVGTG